MISRSARGDTMRIRNLFDPLSEMEKFGFGINIPDPQHCIFRSFLTLYPGWKNSDSGSGINIPDPQHCIFRSFLARFIRPLGYVGNSQTAESVNLLIKVDPFVTFSIDQLLEND